MDAKFVKTKQFAACKIKQKDARLLDVPIITVQNRAMIHFPCAHSKERLIVMEWMRHVHQADQHDAGQGSNLQFSHPGEARRTPYIGCSCPSHFLGSLHSRVLPDEDVCASLNHLESQLNFSGVKPFCVTCSRS